MQILVASTNICRKNGGKGHLPPQASEDVEALYSLRPLSSLSRISDNSEEYWYPLS